MSFSLVLISLFAAFNLPGIRRLRPFATVRDRAAMAAGLFFIGAGALHFLSPEQYDRMIPPFLPSPRLWTYLSGALEIAGGLGLLMPRWRVRAAVGLVLLLFAILPANIHVAVSGVDLEALPFPRWYFIARVPFQLVYVAWVAWAGGLVEAWRRRRSARRGEAARPAQAVA